jgi:putative hydrolase of the HAD superfamily
MSSQSQIGNRKSQIPSLVIFDLGRVLCRICDGWQHACTVAGVSATPAGRLSDEAYARVHAAMCAHEVGEIDAGAFGRVAAPLLGISVEDFLTIHNAYTIGPYDGAAVLLDDLRAAGVATACLSNTNANHWRLMHGPGPAQLPLEKLNHRFASHLLGLRKPDERIYAHVEQATGVTPAQIVFFDDIEENVAAAQRRGWHGHRIATDSDPIAQLRRHLAGYGVLG